MANRLKSSKQEGQVLIDYLMTLLLVISLVSAIGYSFRRSVFALWQAIAREVSAACPGCPSDPKIRFR